MPEWAFSDGIIEIGADYPENKKTMPGSFRTQSTLYTFLIN